MSSVDIARMDTRWTSLHSSRRSKPTAMSTSQCQAQILDKEEALSSLPPEWATNLTATIASRVSTDDQTIVVLDDDPTGTQTVYDLPVLTEWSESTIDAEFGRGTPAFYIMTNSRSLTPDDAAVLNDTIARRVKAAAKKYARRLSVISRSDSTLRGHYPLEIDVLAKALQEEDTETPSSSSSSSSIDGQIVVPFFLEGGRLTINNIHYVADGTKLVPAAQTPFARTPRLALPSQICWSMLRKRRGEDSNGMRWRASAWMTFVRVGRRVYGPSCPS